MTWACSLESAVNWLTLKRLQESYSYRHNLVLHRVVSNLSSVFAGSQTNKTIHVYADLLGMHASVSPQVTIPPTLLVTFYRPDIVIYNESINSIALLDLTCTLYSIYHLESARDCKQTNCFYWFYLSWIRVLVTIYNSPCPHCTVHLVSSKPHYFQGLSVEDSWQLFISTSGRIFLAVNCAEWSEM